MGHRWLLSLLCLSALFLSLVQLTRADGELRVNERLTKLLFEKGRAEVFLPVENSTGKSLNALVKIELLDPLEQIRSQITQAHSIATGSQTLQLSLPISIADFKANERARLLLYRLRYQLTVAGAQANTISEGILSLSEITNDLFEVRITTSGTAREGGRYRARVQTVHPITYQPVANVRINGEIALDGDNERPIKVSDFKLTDPKGYAVLDFVLPPRFARHVSANGEIHVIATKGAIQMEQEGEVIVDQNARILISTDKPLYQPSQTMHVRGLLFTPAKRALANQEILIRICDSEGTTIFRTMATSSRFGIVNADWPIPENTRLGDYQIWMGVNGEEEAQQAAHAVRISRYDLPNFLVSVEPDRDYYLPGQNADVTVRADYLFGQPVAHGHVRVVRETNREWNYREQKWEIETEDEYAGETDDKGSFVAHIDLASAVEDIEGSESHPFKDVTYAAYFTDPTTNRTEQRRFDLRVTQQAIHVYIIQIDNSGYVNPALPLRFYISTFYADGAPAQCKVDIRLKEAAVNSLATLQTDRYGLAKLSGVKLPSGLENEKDLNLVVSAIDTQRRKGSKTEEVSIGDQKTLLLETNKALYRAGEAITASITSSIPDQWVVVDVARDWTVIRSEHVQLHNGRGSIVFPYKPDFNDKLTIAAYPDFPASQQAVDTRTIVYPSNSELKVNLRTARASYRPGDEAQVDLNVRGAEGRSIESALGVVVLDKAVEERSRTDQEFGNHAVPLNESVEQFLGLDEQLAGVTLRDLQRTDMTKPISAETDLLAEVLLNRTRDYVPAFYGGDQYERDQANTFRGQIAQQLNPMREALATRYTLNAQYPNTRAALQRLLLDAQIDFNDLRDPWGTSYGASFSIDRQADVLTLTSAGPDKQPQTEDDFSVDEFRWPYFQPLGEAIDRAAGQYHDRTGGFIRDLATLREELSNKSLDLDRIRDRWGQSYRFEFTVHEKNYEIKVQSAGPDRQFSKNEREPGDDFIIWTSSIDYFAEQRAHIEAVLNQYLKGMKRFPQTDQELREALRGSGDLFDTLRDPWNRPYYPLFKVQPLYADGVRLENRADFREPGSLRMGITSVDRIAAFISLRSMGPDGIAATVDDFEVAAFNRVISELSPAKFEIQTVMSGVVLSKASGAIYGIVSDPNDARVAGAIVTVTRSFDGRRYNTATNDEGKYSFADLPPGLYEVRFEAAGFVPSVVTNVLVNVSHLTEVNVTLQVGPTVETVTITAGGDSEFLNLTNSTSITLRRLPGVHLNLVTKSGTSQDVSTPRLREYFPETLVWQPSIETDKQGRAQIKFKLADNITTWKVAVIGSSEDGRIGTNEKEIKAFQPFFVEHDPPRVLTEGDEISLPVVVRNYLERAQKVELEIKPENWFSLSGSARKPISVAAGESGSETFDIRASRSIKDGKQRITASGTEDSDAIEKPITVHPDGEELSGTAGDLLGSSATLELNLPETTIPNSYRAELKIYPNLLAHVTESVEGIMKRPYGCGEQTISSTYPSLLLLRHYKQTGEQFPLHARAERYVEEGYSRLLNYRDESGGFTYWGSGDPDLALTVYALRFLSDAAEVISVDEDVVDGARKWVIKQQRPDGSWASEQVSGPDKNHADAALTAYVARILILTEPGREASADVSLALKRSFNYLSQQTRDTTDPYLLASYALAAIDAGERSRVVNLLRSLPHREDGMTYWSSEINTPFHGWGLAGRIETTALVAMALMKHCNSQTANCESGTLLNEALLFLLKQKDRYGVWHSTQATINVVDAMLAWFSMAQNSSSAESTAEIVMNGRRVQTAQIPIANRALSPITFDITPFLQTGKNRVEIIRPNGSSYASVQAFVNYYVPWSASNAANNVKTGLSLLVKFDKTSARINEEIGCHVEAERVGFGQGMLLGEIGLPPGAEVDRSSLETAMKSSGSTINRYDVLPDRVVVYFWPRVGGVKFDFKFRVRLGMKAKTAPSFIYDYYNPEARAIVPPAKFEVK